MIMSLIVTQQLLNFVFEKHSPIGDSFATNRLPLLKPLSKKESEVVVQLCLLNINKLVFNTSKNTQDILCGVANILIEPHRKKLVQSIYNHKLNAALLMLPQAENRLLNELIGLKTATGIHLSIPNVSRLKKKIINSPENWSFEKVEQLKEGVVVQVLNTIVSHLQKESEKSSQRNQYYSVSHLKTFKSLQMFEEWLPLELKKDIVVLHDTFSAFKRAYDIPEFACAVDGLRANIQKEHLLSALNKVSKSQRIKRKI